VLACAALLLGGLEGSAGAATMTTTGPAEMVFDYSTMACELADFPDIPPNAFRDGLGRTQLTLALYKSHRLIGPDLDHLTHDCQVTLSSDFDPQPANFADFDYLAAPYSLPNGEIWALLHDEYHGVNHPGACPAGSPGNCRYNTITLARSTTNGDTFIHLPPPTNLVASVPYQYTPDSGRLGAFQPTHIIQKDGFYYSFFLISREFREQEAGECLMRTRDITDPKSWRAWDGEGFNVTFIDPYRESADPISRHVCKPVDIEDVKAVSGLVYDTFINKYVAIGAAGKYEPSLGQDVWGFYYQTSDDLIHWGPRQLLFEITRFNTHMCGEPDPLAYPTIIDPTSTSRNFETAGQTAYVYYVRFNYQNCVLGNDRDMLRVPVQLSP
jgi:hypothetical protein